MWHEARRQDKRVKLLAGSQLKRSQQRKADEIKKQVDPLQLLRLQGTACPVHFVSEKEARANMGRATLVPWQNHLHLMIDRFDVRSSMDPMDLADAEAQDGGDDGGGGGGGGGLDNEDGIVSSSTPKRTHDDDVDERMQPGSKYFERRFEAYRDLVQAKLHGLTEAQHLAMIDTLDDTNNPFSPKLDKPPVPQPAKAAEQHGASAASAPSAAIGFDYGTVTASHDTDAAAADTKEMCDARETDAIERSGRGDEKQEPSRPGETDDAKAAVTEGDHGPEADPSEPSPRPDLETELPHLDRSARRDMDDIARTQFDISYFCTFLERSRNLTRKRARALTAQKRYVLQRVLGREGAKAATVDIEPSPSLASATAAPATGGAGGGDAAGTRSRSRERSGKRSRRGRRRRNRRGRRGHDEDEQGKPKLPAFAIPLDKDENTAEEPGATSRQHTQRQERGRRGRRSRTPEAQPVFITSFAVNDSDHSDSGGDDHDIGDHRHIPAMHVQESRLSVSRQSPDRDPGSIARRVLRRDDSSASPSPAREGRSRSRERRRRRESRSRSRDRDRWGTGSRRRSGSRDRRRSWSRSRRSGRDRGRRGGTRSRSRDRGRRDGRRGRTRSRSPRRYGRDRDDRLGRRGDEKVRRRSRQDRGDRSRSRSRERGREERHRRRGRSRGSRSGNARECSTEQARARYREKGIGGSSGNREAPSSTSVVSSTTAPPKPAAADLKKLSPMERMQLRLQLQLEKSQREEQEREQAKKQETRRLGL